MSIGDMVNVSRFLFAAAGLCGMAAAVLFFVLDIPKCWKMVSGKAVAGRIKTGQAGETGTAGECGVTLPLGDRTENILVHDRTAAICGDEQ